jgi:hypothetical protein
MASRSTSNTNHTDIQLTRAGNTAVRNLIRIAEDYPDHWKSRYAQLADMGMGPSSSPDIVPITAPELFHVIRN